MKSTLKTAAMAASLTLNAIFVALFAMASASERAALSYHRLPGDGLAAAVVVNVPSPATVVFGPPELTFKRGERASLQYSVMSGRDQANRVIAALYDRDVVSVEETAYGIVITALAEGSTTMQSITADGIIDVARVTVVAP